MIYIKQYNSLFDSPRVEEPTEQRAASYIDMDYLERVQYDQDRNAYNKWLSSKIEVIGDHNWVDGGEYLKGIHFKTEEREDYVGGSGHTSYPTFTIVAIPITQKPDGLVPGMREEDSLASDKAQKNNLCQ